MKKSILFFAAFIAVALTSMVLTSCGGDDDDDPVISEYVYATQITIPDELAAVYSNLIATIQYPDGTVHEVKFNGYVATDKYTCKLKGNVVAKIEGDLVESAVEDDKTYDTTFVFAGACNSHTDGSFLKSSKKGSQLKEKAQKLSDLAGTKHTFIYEENESK